jgi:hypothetical protein
MTFPNEVNKILLGDGILFIIQGFLTFAVPSPQRLLKEKIDSKLALPPFKDVRRALGAVFMSIGLIVIAVGGTVSKGLDLDTIAIFRAISLVPIVFAGYKHVTSKSWKTSGSQIMFTSLQAILILVYVYFGVVEPL